MIPYNLLIRCLIYIRLLPTIRIYTIILENSPPPLCESINSINHLQYDSIDFTLFFQNTSLFIDSILSIDLIFLLHWNCPYNQTLHYHFIKYPHTWASPYILSIICNLILLVLHYHFKKSPLVEWSHSIYWSAVSFASDLSLQPDSTLSFSNPPPPLPPDNPYILFISCNIIKLILRYHFKKYSLVE